MARILSALFALAILGACHVHRESASSDLDVAATATDVVPSVSIDDLAWLEGAWRGTGLGGDVEESWSGPADGSMVGHFRLVRDGAVAFYEIMTIGPIDAAGNLGLRVKHFAPDLTGWEEKDVSVTFPIRSIDGGTVVLEGARIERMGNDRMAVTVSISQRDGSTRDEVFRYRRIR